MDSLQTYLDENLPPIRQEELRVKLGFSEYQWTWYMKRPENWTSDKVIILARYLNTDLSFVVTILGVGNAATREALLT